MHSPEATKARKLQPLESKTLGRAVVPSDIEALEPGQAKALLEEVTDLVHQLKGRIAHASSRAVRTGQKTEPELWDEMQSWRAHLGGWHQLLLLHNAAIRRESKETRHLQLAEHFMDVARQFLDEPAFYDLLHIAHQRHDAQEGIPE